MISLLLKYFSFEAEIGYAIGIGIAISACAFAGAIIHHSYYFNIGRYGMRLRLACSGLIYRKVKFSRLVRKFYQKLIIKTKNSILFNMTYKKIKKKEVFNIKELNYSNYSFIFIGFKNERK